MTNLTKNSDNSLEAYNEVISLVKNRQKLRKFDRGVLLSMGLYEIE